jgi:hypothetical protein
MARHARRFPAANCYRLIGAGVARGSGAWQIVGRCEVLDLSDKTNALKADMTTQQASGLENPGHGVSIDAA